MDMIFYSDLTAFQRRASPLLKCRCAVNSLKLGIIEYYSEREKGSDGQVFALGVEHGEVVAVFVQTGSLYFCVNEAYLDEAIRCAIEEFLKRQIIVPKVMGYGDTALRFAESWERRTQCDVMFAGKDYLYEIMSIGNGEPTRGALCRAASGDMHELKPLFREYYREDLNMIKTDKDLEQSITRQLAEDEVYFWDDDGVKSMVTAILPFDAGVELTNVFTPQEHRRMGYAAACIGEACRSLLRRYPRIVLFVSQDNLAANSLYSKIGFHLVNEMNSYTLSAK
jgi:GNAT superfamily N-acetyltransferase